MVRVPSSIKSFYCDEEILYGDLQGVFLMVMLAPPTEAGMRRAGPALAEMTRRYPGGYVNLTWVLPEAGFSMDGPSRDAATELTKQYLASIRATATVIEGTGFRQATVRAIVSGLHLVSRMKCPQSVFESVEEALSWSQGQSAPEVRSRFDRGAAERAMTELRAAIYPAA